MHKSYDVCTKTSCDKLHNILFCVLAVCCVFCLFCIIPLCTALLFGCLSSSGPCLQGHFFMDILALNYYFLHSPWEICLWLRPRLISCRDSTVEHPLTLELSSHRQVAVCYMPTQHSIGAAPSPPPLTSPPGQKKKTN